MSALATVDVVKTVTVVFGVLPDLDWSEEDGEGWVSEPVQFQRRRDAVRFANFIVRGAYSTTGEAQVVRHQCGAVRFWTLRHRGL